MTRIVIGSTNPGKLREITGILNGLPLELLTLAQFSPITEPEETGDSFAANARHKALYYAAATGLPVVADDSGLEIAALGNAPGVHSARWQGTDYAHKFQKIRELLRERGVNGSAARFVCSVALAERDRILFETQATVEGELAPEPRGTNGFGYDPIFFYPPLGRTLAELTPDEKASVSHRGKAFRRLREFLQRP